MEKIMKKIKKYAWAFFCIGAGTVNWTTAAVGSFTDEDNLY